MKGTKRILLIVLICFACVAATVFSSCDILKDLGLGRDDSETHTITFVVDGREYAVISTAGNEIIKLPDNPVKDGLTFDGWYIDEGTWETPFTANGLAFGALTVNLTVYANFVVTTGHVHSPGDWIITDEPTCTKLGKRIKQCNVCKEMLDEETISAEHVFGADDMCENCGCSNLLYSEPVDGKVSVTGFVNTDANHERLVIPEYYNGNLVVGVKENAFIARNDITEVRFGENVTTFGDLAFNSCLNIQSVYYAGDMAHWCSIDFYNYDASPLSKAQQLYLNGSLVEGDIVLPDGLTQVNGFVFDNYTLITGVVVPDSVTIIGSGAFYGCSNLKSVTLSSNTEVILFNAFRNCKSLTEIKLPATLKVLDRGVFYGCSQLGQITIPVSVTSIGKQAFDGSMQVYYEGTAEQWTNVKADLTYDDAAKLLYFYSESKPQQEGNYWHYVDGQIVHW